MSERRITPTGRPSFRVLDAAGCERVLARNHVARLAYAFRDRVDIEPVHYVLDRGVVFGRTAPGSKLATIAHSRWVAVEVDEVEGLFDWRSVVAHGTFLTLDPDVPGAEAREWQRGVALLRELIPETGTPDDPVPFRSVVFSVHLDSMTGREAIGASS